MKKTQIKFEGIDDWNRPVFKSTTSNIRYGSVFILFDYGTSANNILQHLTIADLCYFGQSFNCEPMGSPIAANKIEIIK